MFSTPTTQILSRSKLVRPKFEFLNSWVGKSLIVACLSLLSLKAKAQDQRILAKVKLKMPHAIADILAKTSVLPDDITVFHWSKPGVILYKGPAETAQDPQIQEYLNKYTERYWSSVQGDGLYFAEDPISSDYVGPNLLVITLKKGTRYFNDSISVSDFFSDEAAKEFEDVGCSDGAPSFGDGNFSTLSASCTKVRKALAQITNLRFYIYSYINRDLPAFCKPKLGKVALVVYDPSAFVPGSAAVFDTRFKVPAAFEWASKIVSNFKVLTPQIGLDPSIVTAVPQVSDQEFETWGKAHLFDCAW